MASDGNYMQPATPLEFTELYRKFTEDLDAPSVNTLVSEKMTIIWANGEPQTTYSREEQLATLSKMYEAEKAADTRIRAADCIITQHARDFAVVKFTWAISRHDQEMPTYAHVGYVIRREAEGWRIVYVMEFGLSL